MFDIYPSFPESLDQWISPNWFYCPCCRVFMRADRTHWHRVHLRRVQERRVYGRRRLRGWVKAAVLSIAIFWVLKGR
jgi:hypothetical protein